jgi:hypothetical protein
VVKKDDSIFESILKMEEISEENENDIFSLLEKQLSLKSAIKFLKGTQGADEASDEKTLGTELKRMTKIAEQYEGKVDFLNSVLTSKSKRIGSFDHHLGGTITFRLSRYLKNGCFCIESYHLIETQVTGCEEESFYKEVTSMRPDFPHDSIKVYVEDRETAAVLVGKDIILLIPGEKLYQLNKEFLVSI